MDIVKVFATILTLAGMVLLIFACLAFMQGNGTLLGVDITQRGYTLLPFLLGIIFFSGGIYLFRGLVGSSSRNR